MDSPLVLGKVPHIAGQPLQIKATQTGVTFLPERKYKKRYTGSKQSAVDINGKLYVDAKELDKLLREGRDRVDKGRRIKKAGVAPCSTLIVNSKQIQSYNTNTEPTSRSRKKTYTVNKREVRQRLLGYINTQRGRKELYFWTITFPAGTPDDICYQAFNTWLTSLRKYRLLKDYLWVGERQDGKRITDGRAATNTLHFHIAIPHKMPVKRANSMMAGTLKTFARRGAIPFSVAQCARYNGVDLAKNRKTGRVVNFAVKKGNRALTTYLTKYVTKNDAEFSHLAWHNSRGFSSLFTGVAFSIEEFNNLGFRPFLNWCRIFKMEFATFIPWLFDPPPLLTDHLFKLNTYIQSVIDGRKAATGK